MNGIKEVTVFSNGDSSKLSTWSNVPYFFTETLLSKGIRVNRVDLSPNALLRNIFNKSVYRFARWLNEDTTYSYFRSFMHFADVRMRIRKAVNQHPSSDAFIFLTFSFSSAGLTNKPTIQFCDWTYDHYFRYFRERMPDYFEKQCINRENSQIERSDLVIALFPSTAKSMRKRYTNKNIHYIGNVVNSLYDATDSSAPKRKKDSNNLLFVGSRKYIDGARSLIIAFLNVKQVYPQLRLHIIGINSADFESLPEGVYCYGYLDKGKDTDRDVYYELLREARLFINTTPKWGAFSAAVEAMHFYTPVITSPHDDFVETFGCEINFGYYCENNSPLLIQHYIMKLLNDNSYESLCINAHKSVEMFTWSAFIDKFLGKIEDTLMLNNAM